MKINEHFASIHGYLCADGYVIQNPPSQKHKYYYIGLRNTNEVLLKDFQNKFQKVFGLKPIIKDGRCKIQNKKLVLMLLDKYSFYSANWFLPKFSYNLLKYWLRSYFDCDSWVSAIKGKDRKIGLDSINKKGLYEIRAILFIKFRIKSSIKPRKGRNTYTLCICGKENLIKFKKNIGFLHPEKSKKLNDAINSYVDYFWKIPNNRKDLLEFIKIKGRVNVHRKAVRFNSIIKTNLIRLKKKFSELGLESKLNGPWTNPYGSKWYCLSIKLQDYNKLIGGENIGI